MTSTMTSNPVRSRAGSVKTSELGGAKTRGPMSSAARGVGVSSSAGGVARRASVETGTGNLKSSVMLTTGQSQSRNGVLENTYQLEPLTTPSGNSLQKILADTMSDMLTDRMYGPEVGGVAKDLVDTVKRKAREQGTSRYKYVCVVSIGPMCSSALSVTSRCLWTPSTDTFAEHSFKNASIYATAVLFAVYAE